MRYHRAWKILAFVLAVVAGVGLYLSAVGFAVLEEQELYTIALEDWTQMANDFGCVTSTTAFGLHYGLICWLYELRFALLWVMGICFLAFLAGVIYLCYSAGVAPGGTKKPGGLNRLPLDLYAAAAAGICGLGLTGVLGGTEFCYTMNALWAWILVECLAAGVLAVCLGFLMAFCAQIRQGIGYVWRHSAVGFLAGKLWRLMKTAARFCLRWGRKLLEMLPVMWQWLLTAAVLGMILLFGLILSIGVRNLIPLIPAVLLCIAAVVYGGYCFGVLLTATRKLAAGELHIKVDKQRLFGAFGECARNLESVSDVAVTAAQKQMNAERMRVELVTNVSHDIKTPLTSIINYVDLLQKTEDPEKRAQYCEVLDRQCQQMKKLIEDLVEMSKASSGNITVNATTLNGVEAVNQALGEFTQKLTEANLTPVFAPSRETVPIFADGRLTWRVLSNLLSNVVKYSLPGTRVYIDMIPDDSGVTVSVKNISRDPVAVDPEELTERFVRGDASRNTEGSGLGLNIARSLMELQKGSLQVSTDGDLFKVTLRFLAG